MFYKISLISVIIFAIAVICAFLFYNRVSEADFTTEIVDLSYFSRINDPIVFQSNKTGNFQLYRIMPSGRDLTRITENEYSDEYPVYSPDKSMLAFHRIDLQKDTSNIMVLHLNSGKEINITRGDNKYHDPAFLNNYSLAFDCERRWQIYMSDVKTHNIIQLTEFSGRNILPNFSPDEKYMAFTRSPVLGWNVYIMKMSDKSIEKLTDGFGACRPHFHSDSRNLAYVSSEGDGKGEIWMIDIEGKNKKRVTNYPETYDYYPSFSPDGKYIVFARVIDDKLHGNWDLWIITSDGRKAAQLTDWPSQEKFPCWSR